MFCDENEFSRNLVNKYETNFERWSREHNSEKKSVERFTVNSTNFHSNYVCILTDGMEYD
jgi:hypothetical protein